MVESSQIDPWWVGFQAPLHRALAGVDVRGLFLHSRSNDSKGFSYIIKSGIHGFQGAVNRYQRKNVTIALIVAPRTIITAFGIQHRTPHHFFSPRFPIPPYLQGSGPRP